MVIYNSIGYITLVPRDFLLQCYVTVLKFYLSALPSHPPASLSEHSLSVSLLVLFPATSFPPLMLGPT
jgi:hypothetical protein